MPRRILLLLGCCLLVVGSTPSASAQTFLDRNSTSDLRVATWNIFVDSIFPDVPGNRSAKFSRAFAAISADIWAFQELYRHNGAQLKVLLDASQPLGTPAGWHVYETGEHAIASKFPLSLTRPDTVPAGNREAAMAMIDLPDELYPRDLYMMNAHYTCCSGADGARQQQSDAFANWMRDAKSEGGDITLPFGTPMMVLGDLNIVESLQPLNTLFTGDIQNNTRYGPDSAPDWDGSNNVKVDPLHNAVGPEFFTWRDDLQMFAPSRLDYITYTDSVMSLRHAFVLNTLAMSESDLAATGLQPQDSVYNAVTWDHLPVVADFRIWGSPLGGDFDGDNDVDVADLGPWQNGFGASGAATRPQGDADGDMDVDGADFLLWQQQLQEPSSEAAAAPEPASFLLAAGLLLTAASYRRQRGLTRW